MKSITSDMTGGDNADRGGWRSPALSAWGRPSNATLRDVARRSPGPPDEWWDEDDDPFTAETQP